MIRAVVLSGLIVVGFVVSGLTGDDFGAQGRMPPPPPPFHGIFHIAPPPPPPARQAEETHFLPQVPQVLESGLS
ncbi:hypothetical protein [Rhodalgimonas zhirmunskyi]|uniref:Uncharacterized protein n=1 Tax=Rhodalgimonas zhirmunskyi TaxID=2964767 RepID=A0AAJ1UF20_9RHOB|nr:hypothetical protein [Rhodoalgimonas zhirmunskyi]MDQ2094887.1 hypothetical protein [Rhodoalgimonas zhirmunskyi]